MIYDDDIIGIYARSFRDNWELPALSLYGAPEQTITYEQLSRRITRIHLLFKEVGIKPGDKVALTGKNTPTWITVFMATITYGATIVPILPEFNHNDMQHIINHSESEMLFIDETLWENLDVSEMPLIRVVISLNSRKVIHERDMNKTPVTKFVKSLTRRFNKVYPDGFKPENVDYRRQPGDAIAEINYTSGTTGFSKGVMIKFANIAGNVGYGIESKLHYRGSRCLAFLPLAHAYGCAFDLLTPLATGSHITVFGRVPTPRLLLDALDKVKPSLICCVPLILEKIYRKQIVPMITRRPIRWALAIPYLDSVIFSKIRNRLVDAFGGEFSQVIVGGAPINGEVEEFLYKIKFPFTVGYGMTECAPLISYTPQSEFIPTSCGHVLPNMEVRIDSADPVRIPGEICVRGQNVMAGYYKNKEATEAVFDSDGWLHTGDMGTLSADNTLFIKGRCKTMILSANGQNIYPEEIEAKLNNMPFVSESLVMQRGNGLVALVYPDYEQGDGEKMTAKDFERVMEINRQELNKIVAPYEQIQSIRLVPEEFEKTPKKSIKRYLYDV